MFYGFHLRPIEKFLSMPLEQCKKKLYILRSVISRLIDRSLFDLPIVFGFFSLLLCGKINKLLYYTYTHIHANKYHGNVFANRSANVRGLHVWLRNWKTWRFVGRQIVSESLHLSISRALQYCYPCLFSLHVSRFERIRFYDICLTCINTYTYIHLSLFERPRVKTRRLGIDWCFIVYSGKRRQFNK